MYFITICPTNEHNEIDDLASITLIDSKRWTQRTQRVSLPLLWQLCRV